MFSSFHLLREEAQPIFDKMVESNRKGLFVATLPYKIGIAAALVAGFGSLPMIFDINTVLWFNEIYVTSGTLYSIWWCWSS